MGHHGFDIPIGHKVLTHRFIAAIPHGKELPMGRVVPWETASHGKQIHMGITSHGKEWAKFCKVPVELRHYIVMTIRTTVPPSYFEFAATW